MSWNHRVVKTTEKSKFFDEPIISYGIHEVYYDKNGKITGISEEPIRINEDNHLELYNTIARIENCLNKKTVVYETLEEEI
jgi:hypothetical protein